MLHLGTTLVVYIIDRRFDPLFFMEELFRLEILTSTPSEKKLIKFIEDLTTIRSSIVKTKEQIDLVEKMSK
jgi:hypothetical protein